MKVGLFIPCYVDQLYPHVGIATYQLLKKLGVEVHYPFNQTCCGQPMANAGFEHLSHGCKTHFITQFQQFDYIVCPSGSCTLHIKQHVLTEEDSKTSRISNIYELSEFLTDVLQVKKLHARFPHRVGFHQSCHGQRGLYLSQMSERVEPYFSKPLRLLEMVTDLEMVLPTRSDECCGFGGTFCVTEEAISVKMGKDRINDHIANDVAYITAVDMSCLMHLEGILKRNNTHVKIIHLAEILNAE
jgi:L-lactate dehydrogenase complex protein LldE